MLRRWWRALRGKPDPVTAVAAPEPRGLKIGWQTNVPPVAQDTNAFTLPPPPKGVLPAGKSVLAMDWSPDVNEVFAWAMQGAFQEGIGFLGYPYLAQLTQRPEYRRISEIIAKEMTRKWIKVTATGEGKADKVKLMEEALIAFNVQEVFRKAIEVDGFFGRAQIFIDTGANDPDELNAPLIIDKRKIKTGGLKGLRVVEPMWTYPGSYNSNNPLAADFYRPRNWYIQGQTIDRSRLLTLVMRELPDILKPAYAFGGLSMSQMAKPYVDNWLRTRQSVSDLLHSFSTMVLATDLSTILQDGGSADMLIARAQLFNQTRDNRGLMMVNKESEELTNVAVPLGTIDSLQAQSQEQMSSVAGIPLVVLLGITPSGLNASSEGEIQTFNANMNAEQERFIRPPLKTVFDVVQLSTFGEIDPGLGFQFVPLGEADEEQIAANRKTQADTDAVYITAGVIDPTEVRERLAGDDESPYHGLDLSKVIEPPMPDPAAEGDPANDPDDDPAQDAEFNEADHPRGEGGEFGSGAGEASRKDRAEKAGFNTKKVWYHGSSEHNIESFDPDKTSRGIFGRGIYITRREGLAGEYAGATGKTHRVFIKSGARILDLTTPEGRREYETLSEEKQREKYDIIRAPGQSVVLNPDVIRHTSHHFNG